MPKLTIPLVRQALRDVPESCVLRDALLSFLLGWIDESSEDPYHHVPNYDLIPDEIYTYYLKGHHMYSYELALEKGPLNVYSGKFLSSSDTD